MFLQPNPSGPASMPWCFGNWGTWHQGPHHRKVPKPLAPHPIFPSDPKWATAVAVGPAQTDTASLPCTGHQLYLPQQGSALVPQPSTICPLRLLRGQPSLGHPLSLALGSHTGDRPRQIAAPWERLDAALCPLSAPSQTHAPRSPPYLVSLFLTTGREGETNPLVS